MALEARAFLEAITRGASVFVKDLDETATVISGIKNARTGINEIDAIWSELPIEHSAVDLDLEINGVKFRDLIGDLRVGEINSVLERASIGQTVSAADEAALKNALRPLIPDFEFNDIAAKYRTIAKYHADLDVKAADSGNALKQQLSLASQKKVESTWSKIKKTAGKSAVAFGVTSACVLSGDMWSALNDATKARNGCFLISKLDGKAASGCKLTPRSCGGSKNALGACRKNLQLRYNVRLMLLDALANNVTDVKKIVRHLTGKDLKSKADIDTVLSSGNGEHIATLENYYNSSGGEITSEPCQLAGDAPPRTCISCDPSALPTSFDFVDSKGLAANMTLKCVTDSTLLKTLVDLTTSLGIEAFDDAKAGISGNLDWLKKYSIMAVIVVVLAAIVTIALKFYKNRTTQIVNRIMPPAVVAH